MTNRPAIFYNSGRPGRRANFIGAATLTGDVLEDLENQEGEAAIPDLTDLVATSGTLYNQVYIDISWSQSADNRVREYEVQVERDGDGVVMAFRTDNTSARIEPVLAGASYVIKVWDILTSGARNQNLEETVQAAIDNTNPADPQGLTLGAGLRTITATWDDNNDPDVKNGIGRYRIQIAKTTNFTPLTHDKVVSGTITSFTNLDPNTLYWVRLKAVDTSGNESGWSTSVSDTTSQSISDDIASGAIDTRVIDDFAVTTAKIGLLQVDSAQIADLAVDNAKIADLAVDNAKIANATITSAKIIDLTASKLTAGTIRTQTISIGENFSTGTVTLTGGASGQITQIQVDGVNTMSGAVAFDTDLETTASNVAANIDAFSGTPFNYTATSNGPVISISAADAGPLADGKIVTVTSVTITTSKTNMTGGATNGILKSANYNATAGSEAGFLITGDGDAFFNSATIRGNLVAGTIAIGGTPLAPVFEVDENGLVSINGGTIDGSLILSGINADNITAGTITGRTLQTSSTGARVEITNSDDIRFYNSSNVKTCTIDGNSGASNTFLMSAENGKNLIMQTFRSSGTVGSVYIQTNGTGGTPIIRMDAGRNATVKPASFELGGTTVGNCVISGKTPTSGNSWSTQVLVVQNEDSSTDLRQAGISIRDARRGYAQIIRLSTSAGNSTRLLFRNSADSGYCDLYANTFVPSSPMWKQDMHPIKKDMRKVKIKPGATQRRRQVLHDITPIGFKVNGNETTGFNADEFAEVYPKAVQIGRRELEDVQPGEDPESDYPLGFAAGATTAVLWAEVQDMDDEYEELFSSFEDRLKALEQKLQTL